MSSCGGLPNGGDNALAIPSLSPTTLSSSPPLCHTCRSSPVQTSPRHPYSNPCNSSCFDCTFTYLHGRFRSNLSRHCHVKVLSTVFILLEGGGGESVVMAEIIKEAINSGIKKKKANTKKNEKEKKENPLMINFEIIYLDTEEMFHKEETTTSPSPSHSTQSTLRFLSNHYNTTIHWMPLSLLYEQIFPSPITLSPSDSSSSSAIPPPSPSPSRSHSMLSPTSPLLLYYPPSPSSSKSLISFFSSYCHSHVPIQNLWTHLCDIVSLMKSSLLRMFCTLSAMGNQKSQIIFPHSSSLSAVNFLQSLTKGADGSLLSKKSKFKISFQRPNSQQNSLPPIDFLFPFRDVPTRLMFYCLRRTSIREVENVAWTLPSSNGDIKILLAIMREGKKSTIPQSLSPPIHDMKDNDTIPSMTILTTFIPPPIRFSFSPFLTPPSPYSFHQLFHHDLNYLSLVFLTQLDHKYQNSVFNVLRTGGKMDQKGVIRRMERETNNHEAHKGKEKKKKKDKGQIKDEQSGKEKETESDKGNHGVLCSICLLGVCLVPSSLLSCSSSPSPSPPLSPSDFFSTICHQCQHILFPSRHSPPPSSLISALLPLLPHTIRFAPLVESEWNDEDMSDPPSMLSSISQSLSSLSVSSHHGIGHGQGHGKDSHAELKQQSREAMKQEIEEFMIPQE